MKNPPQTISPSVPSRISQGPSPEAPRSLLACFLDIVADWEALFPQPRTYLRAVRQALGTLICLGRRTLSRVIWTNGGQHKIGVPITFCSHVPHGIRPGCSLLLFSAPAPGVQAVISGWRSMTRACARPDRGFNRPSFSAIHSPQSFT